MGRDLGIEAAQESPLAPAEEPQPTGEAIALTGFDVRVTFRKGSFLGVLVESQRADETEWTNLGIDFHSPYLDSRAPGVAGQPEVRRYRLRYVGDEGPTGAYSDVMAVTARP
jgi:hypothetical protein